MEGTLLTGTQGMVSGLADGVVTTANEVPTRFANLAPALFGDAVDIPVGIWVGLRSARSRTEFEQTQNPFLPLPSSNSEGDLAGRVTVGAWSSADAAFSVASSAGAVAAQASVFFGAPRGVSGSIVFCKRRDIFFRPERTDSPCSTCPSHNSCYSDSGAEAARLLVQLADPVVGVQSRPFGLLRAGEYAELVGGLPCAALVDRLRYSGDEAAAQWLGYKQAHDPSFKALTQAIGSPDWSWRESLTAKLQLCLAVATKVKSDSSEILAGGDLLQRVRVSLESDPYRGDAPWRFGLSFEAAPLAAPVAVVAATSSFRGLFSIVGVEETPAGTVLRASVRASPDWAKNLEAGRALALHFSAAEGFVNPLDVSLELACAEGDTYMLRGVLGDIPAVAITQMRILRHLRDLEMAFTIAAAPVSAPAQSAPTMADLAEFFLVTLFAVPTRSAAQIREALTGVIASCRATGLNVAGLARALAAEPAFSLEESLPGMKKQTGSLLVCVRDLAANMLADEGGYSAPASGGLDTVVADLERLLAAVKQPVAAATLGAPLPAAAVGDEALADVLASLISDSHWLEKALGIDQMRPLAPKPVEPRKMAPVAEPAPTKPPVAAKPAPFVRLEPDNVDLGATMVVSHEQIRQAFKDEKVTQPVAAPPKAAAPKVSQPREPVPQPVKEPNLDETMIVPPGWRPEPKK